MNWLALARELQAMSQTGLHFARDPYDRERYGRLAEIAAEILGHHSPIAPAAFMDWNAREFGYATPKVDVRGVVVADGAVLLVREEADQGRWTLPGGWADVNESPAESVVREVREETGFECEALRLLAVLDREKQGHEPPFPYHVYKLFFQLRIVRGEPTPNRECSALAYFLPDQLPALSVSRVTAAQIQRFCRQMATPDGAADFD